VAIDASPLAADIATGREILRTSRGIVILTGAGLSADSGLTTFRDPKGHWRRHRPEDLATPEAFRRDHCLVWDWYDARRCAAADTAPNAAHLAIAEFALRRDDVVIVTQNVDGLHTLAAREVADERSCEASGEAKALPIELHGCFYRARCSGCGRRHEHRDPIDTSSKQTLPHCAECSDLLRPDAVWFGEPLGEPIDRPSDAPRRRRSASWSARQG
jgi:NAD-dependent deacetylase